MLDTEKGLNTEEEPQKNYSFKLDSFEGPLDLLLFLIKKNEINIYDIPIADITEQYLSYLEYAEAKGLDDLTEFYNLAATLLYIKSQMLLPVEIDFDEELEDPRKELVDRLIEYQKYKKLTDLMAAKEEEAEWFIERKKIQPILPFPEDDDTWQKIDVWDLLKTFSRMITGIAPENVIDLHEEITVNEKIALIHELLESKNEFHFTDLITRPDIPMDIICAFLAILDTVKSKLIGIYQNRLFGDIKIRALQGKEHETGT
ncbi:MAG TPA: segregation/condensation protein A [Sediminispirochaeta sp.]|nr:segregation/condensation protein A [Sediminispirochaeta sp.]